MLWTLQLRRLAWHSTTRYGVRHFRPWHASQPLFARCFTTTTDFHAQPLLNLDDEAPAHKPRPGLGVNEPGLVARNNVDVVSNKILNPLRKFNSSWGGQMSTRIKELLLQEENIKIIGECGLSGVPLTNAVKNYSAKLFVKNYIDDHVAAAVINLQSDDIDESKFLEIVLPRIISEFKEKYAAAIAELVNIRTISDLRAIHEFFPDARSMKRKFIFHGGPTNSGKTYHALKRFRDASSGIYCGPLKLLAFEVYETTNALGVQCSLVTGDDRRDPVSVAAVSTDVNPDGFIELQVDQTTQGIILPQDQDKSVMAHHISCTIEMASTSTFYECAVIDEIQMLADDCRGWSWTRAVFGLVANEIHVCGEMRAYPAIKRMCALTGDSVELVEYKRLSPVSVASKPLRMKYTARGCEFGPEISPGDAIIGFTRKSLFEYKAQVERNTPYKCAVIYGTLPPTTRSAQAHLFNKAADSGYQVLVASDAVGMGLNLNIGRVIFSTTTKYDGIEKRLLNISEVKQIGGRAGRFASKYPKGIVTATSTTDLAHITSHFDPKLVVPDISQVGVLPTFEQLEAFNKHVPPNTSFHDLLVKFENYARLREGYFLCNLETQKFIAKKVAHLNLSIFENLTLCVSPAKIVDNFVVNSLIEFATGIKNLRPIHLSHSVTVPDFEAKTSLHLAVLERLYSITELFRFPQYFIDSAAAMDMRNLLASKIQECLLVITTSPVSNNSLKSSEFNRQDTSFVKKFLPKNVSHKPAQAPSHVQKGALQSLLTLATGSQAKATMKSK